MGKECKTKFSMNVEFRNSFEAGEKLLEKILLFGNNYGMIIFVAG